MVAYSVDSEDYILLTDPENQGCWTFRYSSPEDTVNNCFVNTLLKFSREGVTSKS